ncbi:MAG: DNA-binding response regulator [Archangium gephyra]|uniref:DNA-binding response regulator n=1 Tax=Archangium gephyra TaxID=48 RepID=A0A2W5VCZ9_9BACT|nr:MAG: DNA-binding response regulator [Archangium gephyra]
MSRILVIEDEQDLGSLVEYNLRADGHEAEVVRTGAAGVSRAKAWKPDLILLDLMLPDIAGSEVARLVRENEQRRTPIIMVTARGEEGDRVKGLELGADDYVVKPFSVKELLLRVKAVLRRHGEEPKSDGGQLTKGDIQLDSERHEVRVSGKSVVLTALEFRLLKTFLERPGRVQTRETLLSDVWGIDADITTRTVDTHIKRLREKLGPAGDVIETIRGVGYKLTS